MDKKLEESSEKTANLRRKKYTSPVPWNLFVGWNRPVWTLIKNMKSPDLWFLHCKTKNSRKLQKYPQCLESSKFEDKKSALLGLEPLLVEIEIFWTLLKNMNPWIVDFHMPKCPPTSTASGRTRNLSKSWKKPVLIYYITDLKK